jgi:hypothetical protein
MGTELKLLLDFLFTNVERNTVKICLFVGNGMGPLTTAPVI